MTYTVPETLRGPPVGIKEPVPNFKHLKKPYKEELPNFASTEECGKPVLYLYLSPDVEWNIIYDMNYKQHRIHKPYSGVFSRPEEYFLNKHLYL